MLIPSFSRESRSTCTPSMNLLSTCIRRLIHVRMCLLYTGTLIEYSRIGQWIHTHDPFFTYSCLKMKFHSVLHQDQVLLPRQARRRGVCMYSEMRRTCIWENSARGTQYTQVSGQALLSKHFSSCRAGCLATLNYRNSCCACSCISCEYHLTNDM